MNIFISGFVTLTTFFNSVSSVSISVTCIERHVKGLFPNLYGWLTP
jgi:hypothetical protein